MKIPLFPQEASTMAPQVDGLFWGLMILCSLILVVVFVPMMVFLFKYRRAHYARREAVHLKTLHLELGWTSVLTVIAIGMFVKAAHVYFQLEQPPPNAMDIYVVARQWMWKLQHPSGRREINQLHVPVGERVKLTMTSEDVIHSFFVPAFRVKQDVIPGRYMTLWFEATRPGSYHLFCAEYCGTDHSKMTGWIHVLPRAEYEQWLNEGAAAEPMASVGARLFRDSGCSGCHVGSSIVRAPPLTGLYGRPVPLQSGEVVIADEPYLRDSILLPQSQVAAGYEPLMPTFQGKLSEEEVLQLVAYIKSLAAAPHPTERP